MGCNRKVRFLASELFRRCEGGSISSLCNMVAKQIYLLKRRNLSAISSRIISQPNSDTARKSVNGRTRSFGAFVLSSDSWTLFKA